MDPRITPFLVEAGFFGARFMGDVKLDRPLLTALVERWRPETHTFHLLVGEMTVTHQDVALITGIPIDGVAMMGNMDFDRVAVVHDLLGVDVEESLIKKKDIEREILRDTPEYDADLLDQALDDAKDKAEAEFWDEIFDGKSLLLSWLKFQFDKYLTEDSDEESIRYYARAYIFSMIGEVILPNSSGASVPLMYLRLLKNFGFTGRFSWGSAALASLYRNLCACALGAVQMGGPVVSLQIWSWERIHIRHPRIIEPTPDWLADPPAAELLPPLGVYWAGRHTWVDNPRQSLIYY